MRRRAALLGLPMLALAPPAVAADAPLRLIVPAPPGGSTDILARLLAEPAGAALNQEVRVDNRGGRGGIIGSAAAARAAPDGNTLVLGHNQTHAANQSLVAALPYHVVESFVPVARLATVHHAVVVPVASPARDMEGLAALGMRGGRLTYASSQAGSASHVLAETFVRRTGVEAVHGAFRGGAMAAVETIAGHVDFHIATWPSVVDAVRAGSLRTLCIGAPARLPDFPDIPTAEEAGVPYLAVDAWFGLFAPRGTASARVAQLGAAFIAALEADGMPARATTAGLNPAPLTPLEFAAFQLHEVERWREMAELTGIRLEG